jgi:hypothetical protein
VCVVKGPHTGRRGIIDWIYPDEDWMWISAVYLDVSATTPDASATTADAHATTQNIAENLMVHCGEVVTSKPAQSLTFSCDKGYDVS